MMIWSAHLEKILVINKVCGKNMVLLIHKTVFPFWGTFCFSIFLCIFMYNHSQLFIFMGKGQITLNLSFSEREFKLFFEEKACIILPLCPKVIWGYISCIYNTISQPLPSKGRRLGVPWGCFFWSLCGDLFTDNGFRSSSVWTCLSWTIWLLPARVLCFTHLCRVILISCVPKS